MVKYERAYIFFDTNSLECRHSGKSLFLSEFTVNRLYYEVEDLLRNMKLENKVEICIPDIVWHELREHLVNCYKTERTSIETKISTAKRTFGSLVELNCVFKEFNNELEYSTYADLITQEFLDNPRVSAKIISCPKDQESMEQIIGQAIRSVSPFRTVKINGKEYTDAGFKDALIFNTMIKHTGDQLGILVSNDNDFMEVFNKTSKSNLKICGNAKEIQKILVSEFNVISLDMIEGILTTDEYLMKRILSECMLEEDAIVQNIEIFTYDMQDDSVLVNYFARVDEVKYSFDITYNINANELIEATCELYIESEDEVDGNSCKTV